MEATNENQTGLLLLSRLPAVSTSAWTDVSSSFFLRLTPFNLLDLTNVWVVETLAFLSSWTLDLFICSLTFNLLKYASLSGKLICSAFTTVHCGLLDLSAFVLLAASTRQFKSFQSSALSIKGSLTLSESWWFVWPDDSAFAKFCGKKKCPENKKRKAFLMPQSKQRLPYMLHIKHIPNHDLTLMATLQNSVYLPSILSHLAQGLRWTRVICPSITVILLFIDFGNCWTRATHSSSSSTNSLGSPSCQTVLGCYSWCIDHQWR